MRCRQKRAARQYTMRLTQSGSIFRRRRRADSTTAREAESPSMAQQRAADTAASMTEVVMPRECNCRTAIPIAVAGSPVAARNQSGSPGIRIPRRAARTVFTSRLLKSPGLLVRHQWSGESGSSRGERRDRRFGSDERSPRLYSYSARMITPGEIPQTTRTELLVVIERPLRTSNGKRRDVVVPHFPKIDSLNCETFALSPRLSRQTKVLTVGKNLARIQT